MNKVESMFKHRGVSKAGIVVYKKHIAIEFINECRKYKIAILGIDALLIVGDTIQPSMDNSIDFTSTTRFGPNIWDAAIEFLIEKNDEYYFEIVCADI